ncbi:MAG: hypothetical protein KGJ34_00985 [Patescibacteria group bacterium]|nr:hypothetical protein [Patescibacteria group bacterium]
MQKSPFLRTISTGAIVSGVLSILLFVFATLPSTAFAQATTAGTQTTSGLQNSSTGSLTGVVASLGACTVPVLAPLIGGSFSLALLGQTVGDTALPVHDYGNTLTNAGTTISSNLNLSTSLANLVRSQFLDCAARALARAALQDIAVSTINWINSGFNGSPSFVQNYNQFFTNVAEDAVGNYLQSSNLAFLCDPFQIQVKLAVAQAYAIQGPQQCSLNNFTNSIQGFMTDFSQGGWPAFISFTDVPTNNPYGSFMYAEAGLNSAVAQAQGQKVLDLQLGNGFLSVQQKENCHTVSSTTPPPSSPNESVEEVPGGDGHSFLVCDLVNTTPGTAISDALNQTFNINTGSLIDAKYFDEIISALVSQLIQNTLYSGLSNLSSSGGYGYSSTYGSAITTSDNSLGQDVLSNINPYESSAQNLISIDDQNVSNIQSSLTQAEGLQQCWLNKANPTTTGTSTPLTTEQMAQAQANASSTQPLIDDLNQKLSLYETSAGTASTSIQVLEGYRSQVNGTTDPNTLQTILTNFANGVSSGVFIGDADVTNAQEDQVQLNSELSTDNQTIQNGLTQCHAFPSS